MGNASRISLCLSFIVILGITFHATGYVIENGWTRLLTATVVALTVYRRSRPLPVGLVLSRDFQATSWRLRQQGRTELGDRCDVFRITMRLAISFGLAWIIALFLELAIFSDTISEKIQSDYWRPTSRFSEDPKVRNPARRRNRGAREQSQRARNALSTRTSGHVETGSATAAQLERHEQLIRTADEQIRALDAQTNLRTELRQIEERIIGYAADMNAEELGRRIGPTSSGRAGAGPLYQFAKQQRDVYEAQRQEREKEIVHFHSSGRN